MKPIIDRNYLVYALSLGVGRFKDISRGATIKGVTRNDLVNITFPLPPLPEQRRIAALLDRADSLRQKDRLLLAHYDSLAQSLFLDMFGDPVANEKGWEKLSFGAIGESRLGKMLDAKHQTGTRSFPYLGNSNVQWGKFKLEKLLEMDFSNKDQREFELKNGDLLICEGGEVGRSAIWRDQLKECYFQKAIHRVRLDPAKALPEFVQFLMWMLSGRDGFKDYITVATIAHLTGIKLKSMPIIVPPLELQTKFAELIGQIEGQKAVVRQQMTASEGLFSRLLQDCFGA